MQLQTKKSGGNPLLFWRRSSAKEAEEATPSELEEATPEEATMPRAGGNAAQGGALDDVDDLMAKLAEQQVGDPAFGPHSSGWIYNLYWGGLRNNLGVDGGPTSTCLQSLGWVIKGCLILKLHSPRVTMAILLVFTGKLVPFLSKHT